MDFSVSLKNYLDNQGRLKLFPSKRKYQLLALIYLASQFKKDTYYTEKQVGEILARYHTFGDPCLLRRELFQQGFFDRKLNGSAYWLAEKQPVFPEFGWPQEN